MTAKQLVNALLAEETANTSPSGPVETVLVTGGSGFVASWCIVELLRRGYAVRATVRSLTKEQSVRAAISAAVDPGNRLGFYAADLTSDAGWEQAVAECDYVLHVASPLGRASLDDPEALIATACEGTLRSNLGGAASKVPVRKLPDFVLRLLSLFDPSLRAVTPMLGRKYRHTSEKAQRLLEWHSRPSAVTVVDCAESLI